MGQHDSCEQQTRQRQWTPRQNKQINTQDKNDYLTPEKQNKSNAILKTIEPGEVKITKSSSDCCSLGTWTICDGNDWF